MSERRSALPASGSRGDLPDVNVWLALAIEEHPHHRAASAYWDRDARTPKYFCRVSAMSLVRLLTHQKLMGDKPLSLSKSWALYRSFAGLPGVSMLAEPEGLDKELGGLVTPRLPARLFTDAYFASLAKKAALRLVTFDRDFERFEQLVSLRLSPSD